MQSLLAAILISSTLSLGVSAVLAQERSHVDRDKDEQVVKEHEAGATESGLYDAEQGDRAEDPGPDVGRITEEHEVELDVNISSDNENGAEGTTDDSEATTDADQEAE